MNRASIAKECYETYCLIFITIKYETPGDEQRERGEGVLRSLSPSSSPSSPLGQSRPTAGKAWRDRGAKIQMK